MTVGSWPEAFDAKQVAVTGGSQYVRLGGKGPAVLLLHGFGDTGDMWVPLAEALVKDHAVIVPDLRGMGLSSHPEAGYENSTTSFQPTRRASTSRHANTMPRFMRVPTRSTMPSADSMRLSRKTLSTINNSFAKGKLKMPVLAIGGDHSYGAHLATEIGFAAADVRAAVIKDSGHWIMEEQPEQAVSIILSFLNTE